MKNSPAKSAPKKSSGGAASKGASKTATKSSSNGSSRGGSSNGSASKGAASKGAASKGAASKGASSNGSSRGNSRGQIQAKSDAAAGLRELFEDGLKDIYWAEKALTKALPKMAKNATDEGLRSALQEHLEVTKNQISRLEQVFEGLGKKAQAKKCEAMAGLVKEGEEIMEETEQGVVRDAGIIAGGQKIEHYEIATYGTLAAFARILGETEAQSLLEETLAEEKEADQMLTTIAENSINIEAANEDGEGEEEEED